MSSAVGDEMELRRRKAQRGLLAVYVYLYINIYNVHIYIYTP